MQRNNSSPPASPRLARVHLVPPRALGDSGIAVCGSRGQSGCGIGGVLVPLSSPFLFLFSSVCFVKFSVMDKEEKTVTWIRPGHLSFRFRVAGGPRSDARFGVCGSVAGAATKLIKLTYFVKISTE
jgi:hypothetical protein